MKRLFYGNMCRSSFSCMSTFTCKCGVDLETQLSTMKFYDAHVGYLEHGCVTFQVFHWHLVKSGAKCKLMVFSGFAVFLAEIIILPTLIICTIAAGVVIR